MWVDSRCVLISIPTRLGSRYLCLAWRPRKMPRFGPNVSPRANDPMLPSRKRTQGGASLCPGLSPFAPLGRGDREQARGQRREARGNSQTAGKLWCDPPQVSKDHDACRLASQEFSDHPKRGDCPRVFLKVRPCFYSQFSRRSCLCLAERPRKPPKSGPNGSPRANDPMLPSRKRT